MHLARPRAFVEAITAVRFKKVVQETAQEPSEASTWPITNRISIAFCGCRNLELAGLGPSKAIASVWAPSMDLQVARMIQAPQTQSKRNGQL